MLRTWQSVSIFPSLKLFHVIVLSPFIFVRMVAANWKVLSALQCCFRENHQMGSLANVGNRPTDSSIAKQEELKFVHGLQPASRSCKEYVNGFASLLYSMLLICFQVEARDDVLLNLNWT